MQNEAPDRRTKGYMLMRAILDIGIGILIAGFGIFFFIAPRLGFSFTVDNFYRYSLSGLFLVYGGWRVYRGVKKNYFH